MNAELAAKIKNDIAEGIDCGESRKQLMEAVAYWANVASENAQRLAMAESRLAVVQIMRKMEGLELRQ